MAKIIKISADEANRRLKDVPEDKRFWCCDGRVIKNLEELRTAFDAMSDETFRYHATEQKNDFSNWIRDVVGDDKLARDISKAKSRSQASKVVAERISFLRSKL
jgi:hypothetical protein